MKPIIGTQRVARCIAITLAIASSGHAAGTALAQTAIPSRNSADALDIPTDLTIFGDDDPTVRKPTAIINGEIITQTDVDQRLALFLAANDITIEDDERQQLRLQVLRNLIDETLQIQEAAANEIAVEQAEIDQAYSRVADQFDRPLNEFEAFLESRGTSSDTMKRQIHGELAWSRLLQRNVNVEVSEAEIQGIIDRLQAARGDTEYRVGEIYLSTTPANEAEVTATAQRIVEQIRQGASFVAYARQYSEATTAAVGGDLGWVFPEQLPPPLDAAVPQIPVGAVSEPIRVPGGLSLVAVVDQRGVLSTDPRDAVLSLKQITVRFPQDITEELASPQVEQLALATRQGGGCGRAEEIAATVGGEVVQNDEVRLRDLPGPLQESMLNLQIGEASPPFGSVQDGVRVLIVCGREEPSAVEEPNPEEIELTIRDTRTNARAQRYLRDLRRDAVVEYR